MTPPPLASNRTRDSPAFVAQCRNEMCPRCQIPTVGHTLFLKTVFNYAVDKIKIFPWESTLPLKVKDEAAFHVNAHSS